MQSRPGSSASPRLVRKPSRASLPSSPRPEDDSQKKPTPKRSISNLITELRGAQSSMESIPEPVILTAPQIAEACFTRELAKEEPGSTRTLVLLHDACYGHRFSRLKTSRGTLSMIVERPERILASVLGVASAYVRLGGYYAGAHNALHPKRECALPPPFKIRRTNRMVDLGSSYVTNVHGSDWMAELNTLCDVAEKRLAAGEKEIARTADKSGKDKRSLHEGDLYLCKESLDAFQGALGGVVDAVDAVFDPATETSRAFVAVRPPGHHCSADYPSGFCWINNVHVGIEYAAQIHGLTHAAIIDFDLHHGDGSQSIAWERNSSNNYKRLYAKANAKLQLAPDVGYYSLHDINSYPCEMGDDEKVQAASLCVHNAHGQSIWNVHLQPWKTPEEFWTLYETRYMILLDKAREFLKYHTARLTVEGKQHPKSAIFISAGFDASEWEGEGMQRHKVSVPTEFYARFTADIAKLADTAGTACNGRIISVLEGGYSDRALCSSTLSHLSALSLHQHQSEPSSIFGGLGSSMSTTSGTDLSLRMSSLNLANSHVEAYDVQWWSEENLTALEHHVNPPALILVGGKKVRVGPQPTYATPTESFAYKVIDPAKFARSVSGTMREGVMPSRPLTPPPPEVDWIVATHELSKLLVPTDRQTRSCTAEELAGVKVKKERNSDIGVTQLADDSGKPRQLRTRGKTPITATRAVSGSDRRKTMADLPSINAEFEPLSAAQRRPSRRSSMASTISTASTIQDPIAPPMPPLPNGTGAARPVPSRLPSDSMQVKKTRVPTVSTAVVKPKKTARTSAKSPTKKAGIAVLPFTAQASSPVTTDMSSPIDPEVASVDALTTGIKRITLKVGTREDSDRKAKERLDADRRARALKAAETRRNNKAVREQKAATEKRAPSGIAATMALPVIESNLDYASPEGGVTEINQPVREPVAGGILAQTNDMGFVHDPQGHSYDDTTAGSNLHGDYAAAPPADLSMISQASYASEPQAYNTFLPNRGRPAHELPVFSSTGYIPFAGDAPQPQHATTYQYLPATYQQPGDHQVHQHHSVAFQGGLPSPHSQAYNLQSDEQSHDVWAVPDTPGK